MYFFFFQAEDGIRDVAVTGVQTCALPISYRPIKFGPNAGELTVRELAALLEGDSPVPADLALTPNYSVDVLVVGGGGAGSAAALHAHAHGAKVLLATKLRLGDSNTVMAQGGIQIAITDEDSPVQHFLDTLKGGHMKNDHRLLKTMVEEGPSIAKWLLDLGVLFDRDPDGNLHVKKGGGSSKPRLLTCSDYTGLEIMRSEEHTSELQSRLHLVCRLLLEKKKKTREVNTSNLQ